MSSDTLSLPDHLTSVLFGFPSADKASFRHEQLFSKQPLFEWLVESLVSHSASNIAIPSSHSYANDIGSLPDSFQRRVVIVNDERVLKDVGILLAPFFEEYKIRPSTAETFLSPGHHWVIKEHVGNIYFATYALFMGLTYKLQVDFGNFNSLSNAFRQLRDYSKSSEARACLATLEELFALYKDTRLEALQFTGVRDGEYMTVLMELLEDDAYRNISRYNHQVAFVDRSRHAVAMTKKWTRVVANKSPFKEALTMTSKIISTATGLPFPDTNLAARMLRSRFVPVGVDLTPMLSHAIMRARERLV